MIDLSEFPSFSNKSPSVVIKYVCYLYEDNKPALSVNKLQCRMFTEKNLSIYQLTPTLDALDRWF